MYESGAETGGAFVLFLWVALYFYFAYTQYRIAQKVGHQSPWWAWIPILNFFQQIQLAGKDWWWFVLYLVPVVNIIAMAVVWMGIAKNCRQASFWGILAIIPFVNLFAWGYLAFSSDASQPPAPPEHAPREQEPVA